MVIHFYHLVFSNYLTLFHPNRAKYIVYYTLSIIFFNKFIKKQQLALQVLICLPVIVLQIINKVKQLVLKLIVLPCIYSICIGNPNNFVQIFHNLPLVVFLQCILQQFHIIHFRRVRNLCKSVSSYCVIILSNLIKKAFCLVQTFLKITHMCSHLCASNCMHLGRIYLPICTTLMILSLLK